MQENNLGVSENNIGTECNTNDVNMQRDTSSGMGLLSLVKEVQHLLDTNHKKRIEDIEYKLLEKDEELQKMSLEISMLKAQNEEKEIEIFRMREEINASKQILGQLAMNFGKSNE